MANLIHELISTRAQTEGNSTALLFRDVRVTYSQLLETIQRVSNGLLSSGVRPGERIAIYLPKQPETVAAIFAASYSGASFVPVNPILKPRQVTYILDHCRAGVLITSLQRLKVLAAEITQWTSLHTVIVVDSEIDAAARSLVESTSGIRLDSWANLQAAPSQQPHQRIDQDMVAILYTSGSTGHPKGVVLSHRNMVAGAQSVASYLNNTPADRILAVLPLSFDAGLSQLTTAFFAGASAVLMDFLLPRDVLRAVVHYQVSGLAAVPALWNQLVQLDWPDEVASNLRYITNTGGAMPEATTKVLQQLLSNTDIYLMYGLTEAFRSTYLSPDQVTLRPRSIGKAIPNAEILVVNEAGQLCGPEEPGELVHRGVLVALGYWNDPEKTAKRFRPCPGQDRNLPIPELAVWSGDQVVQDKEGYLYFVNRKDEMIKTSGYRVSPTEIEEVAFGSGLIAGAVAMGRPDAALGQTILLIVTPIDSSDGGENTRETLREGLLAYCRRELPSFMQPAEIVVCESMPLNQNGKIDRRALAAAHVGETEN